MRHVFMLTQRAFFTSNGYEYQMPTDYGCDCKMFSLEREAVEVFYHSVRSYHKQGYKVVSSYQTVEGDGQRILYRFEKPGEKPILLELWKKEVL